MWWEKRDRKKLWTLNKSLKKWMYKYCSNLRGDWILTAFPKNWNRVLPLRSVLDIQVIFFILSIFSFMECIPPQVV